jgi:hypothetical protein
LDIAHNSSHLFALSNLADAQPTMHTLHTQQIMFPVAAVVSKPNRHFSMKNNIIYHLDAHSDALRAAHSSLNISDGVTGGIGTSPRLLQTLDSLSADNAFTFARFCSSRYSFRAART